MPELGHLVAQWGYPGIVVIVLLGNVGVPVPEETALIVAGYLVWQGHLQLSIVLGVAVVSAIVGDNLGYGLGWWFGQPAVERIAHWAAVDPDRMGSMRRVVSRYGRLAVFGGRFIPGRDSWRARWRELRALASVPSSWPTRWAPQCLCPTG